MPAHYEDERKGEDSVDAESALSETFDSTGDAPLLERRWSSRDEYRRTRHRIPSHWPWIVSTVVLALISISLVAMDGMRSLDRRTYETGFDTELGGSKFS